MATASGYSTLVSNNYASSSKTDLSSLSSNDGLSDASITHYGTFQQPASSNGRSRASRHENFPSSSSASTLVNEHDVLLRGRSRQRYTSGISLKGPLRLEKVDEHPPRLLEHINPQLLLENAGCVARDHLASERTFLSYVRTSLAISMTGIVFVQLLSIRPPDKLGNLNDSDGIGHPEGFARPIAVYTILTGILTLVVGVTRYFTVQSTLITGSFKPSRACMALIAFTMSGLIAGAFAVLMAEQRGTV